MHVSEHLLECGLYLFKYLRQLQVQACLEGKFPFQVRREAGGPHSAVAQQWQLPAAPYPVQLLAGPRYTIISSFVAPPHPSRALPSHRLRCLHAHTPSLVATGPLRPSFVRPHP